MSGEVINLIAFLGIATLWSKIEQWHHEHYKSFSDKTHYHIYLARFFLIMCHPTVISGLKEFIVHIIVYSGMVIKGHN